MILRRITCQASSLFVVLRAGETGRRAGNTGVKSHIKHVVGAEAGAIDEGASCDARASCANIMIRTARTVSEAVDVFALSYSSLLVLRNASA